MSSVNLSGISGYDFSGIIQSMVDAYKLPENRMIQKKSDLSAEKTAWQDINTRLAAINSALDTLKDPKTWLSTTASTPSTNNYFSATNTGPGVMGTYNVTIDHIAKTETDVSKELTDATLELAMDAKLGTTYSDNGTASNWDFDLSIHGLAGKTVHVVKSDSTKTAPTMQDVVDSINRSNTGVTASLIQSSSGNYRIAFYSSQTGANQDITFGDTNSFLNTIGVIGAGGTPVDYSTTGLSDPLLGGKVQKADDALLTVNGLNISSSSNTVSSAIQGVSLTLNAPGTSTVTVTSDSSTVQNAVKSFIDAYNGAQGKITSYLSYDADKKKAGILLGDQTLQSLQSSLRQKVASVITGPGNYKLLSDIGIGTSGKSADLALDQNKFMNALAKDPKSVANLFSAPFLGSNPVEAPNNTDGLGNPAPIHDGLTNFLKSYLNPMIGYNKLIPQKLTGYDSQIRDLDNRMTDLEKRATTYEESLKIKFASLESVLSGMKSQGDWLASQTNAMFAQNKG